MYKPKNCFEILNREQPESRSCLEFSKGTLDIALLRNFETSRDMSQVPSTIRSNFFEIFICRINLPEIIFFELYIKKDMYFVFIFYAKLSSYEFFNLIYNKEITKNIRKEHFGHYINGVRWALCLFFHLVLQK